MNLYVFFLVVAIELNILYRDEGHDFISIVQTQLIELQV